MAVDRNTGELTGLEAQLAGLGRDQALAILFDAALAAWEEDGDDGAVSLALPEPDPRGVSPLRGAYGPWLAAQEMRKAAEGWP
jgi:hypothetical protein